MSAAGRALQATPRLSKRDIVKSLALIALPSKDSKPLLLQLQYSRPERRGSEDYANLAEV